MENYPNEECNEPNGWGVEEAVEPQADRDT